ncbi:hypothetical protein LOK49_LG08G02284 [Camellia lanceoleosa]|uniref:Uncharacterized protein n=1 Tax=Camellia lanceoleosa TaxID=1840588 RepID=A0ACC0GPD9_9ERIC|nr:hypothetical protein LOK49_LG08G02284 [Camellia lanceoleosa]
MAAKQSGLGFLDSSENSLPPPPPSLEVLPSEVSSSETYTMEPVHLRGRTLLKGRVSTQEIFHLSNSDLVPGGLKLNWPTFPQIFIKGEFIGGSDVILNMHQTGELKEMLKDIAANQERSEGTDMLNDDHIMIMSLAVTSTSAIAMVPFARIATTVTMMSPTMTVTSSMVVTTTATMSVMFTVNMMNMMSPAVTMMSSAMTSCKAVMFIMSTGAVLS